MVVRPTFKPSFLDSVSEYIYHIYQTDRQNNARINAGGSIVVSDLDHKVRRVIYPNGASQLRFQLKSQGSSRGQIGAHCWSRWYHFETDC